MNVHSLSSLTLSQFSITILSDTIYKRTNKVMNMMLVKEKKLKTAEVNFFFNYFVLFCYFYHIFRSY